MDAPVPDFGAGKKGIKPEFASHNGCGFPGFHRRSTKGVKNVRRKPDALTQIKKLSPVVF
jgi:hypothetical protein